MPEVLDRVMHAATRDFILFCLNRKEDGTRPSALEVSQHPFLSSIEDDDLKNFVKSRALSDITEGFEDHSTAAGLRPTPVSAVASEAPRQSVDASGTNAQ